MSYNVLSIDIGTHNLGFSMLNIKENKIFFDIYDLDNNITKEDKKKNLVLVRAKYLNQFIKELFSQNPELKTVIIEKQVNLNTTAMELMYALTAIIYNYCDNIIIFDPKKKFTNIGVEYTTKNKKHKNLSINMMKNYIAKYYPDQLEKYEYYKKRDDIADSLFMLLIYFYTDNAQELLNIKNCYEDNY